MKKTELEFSEILLELACISPKSYATTIRNRNKALLRKLRLLKPFIGTAGFDVDLGVRNKVELMTDYGCPHCPAYDCGNCIWRRFTISDKWHCIAVSFPSGYAYEDVATGTGDIRIYYYDTCECIRIADIRTITQSRYTMIEKFLSDHIAWADLKIWGENYAR